MTKQNMVSLNLRIAMDRRVFDVARALGLELPAIRDICTQAALEGFIATLEQLQEAKQSEPKH
jgi:predicted secreted protein